ncbi:META domain-containing protein [Lentzea tibetensis]|uniref:META domain-containing protein n=1 Tax=Lentzea tibetensis TaxID=2591470 RepID=A0A563F0Y5_9PSEU|nr:META domain-containing protein [Lentzea tibetensis]TWP53625.1 META domain-containing protein [Lentzea tibetensis]
MRTLTGAALVAGVLLTAACGGGSGQAGAPWGRTFLSSSVTEDGKPRPLVTGTRLRMTFENDELKAHAGCNHIGGRASLDSGKLTVSDLSTTGIGCDPPLQEQDAWFSRFISAGPAWRLEGDDLLLSTNGTELRLTDRRTADPDRPLRSTRWQVDSLADGQSVSSVPAGAEAHLVFADGNRVEGTTGCNRLTGTAVQDGTTITFSEITTTKVQCAQEQQLVENAVLAVLDGPVTQDISADALVLTHPSGRGLHLRASS